MTVCIGVLCEKKNAAVLVADRMVTSSLAIEFEHPVTNKVTELPGSCLALTAGDAFAFTELFRDVHYKMANEKFSSVERLVEVIKSCYQKLRRQKVVERFLMPRGFESIADFYQHQKFLAEAITYNVSAEIERFDYGLEMLVGGMGASGAHLYVLGNPGTSHCLDSVGFHAIGSGTNLALSSLISNNCHDLLPLSEAILVAMDAKVTAENAPGVGRKTDVSVVSGKNIITFQDGEEVNSLKELCRKRRDGEHDWKQAVEDIIKVKLQGESDHGGTTNSSEDK